MRRKEGTLIPIERSIIEVAVRLQKRGVSEFHGFQIAKEIKDQKGARQLTGYGTLYKALRRLQKQGMLESYWEEEPPTDENRPRRRYYRLDGEKAAEALSLSNPAPNDTPELGKAWGLEVSQA